MADPAPPVRRSFPTWAAAALLAAGTVLLFSRSFGYGFVNYDDPVYVTNNAHVQGGLTWPGLVWAFSGASDYWHPLTWLSHMLDWQLFGANATGHRVVNVLWHAANAVLAFLVFRRLTGGTALAWLTAALFAWHPLRVESVVWVTERKDVMSGGFALLTVWAYAGYAERRREGRRAAVRYALTLALFFAGLMCKPSLVTLPLALLVLDFWPLRRFAPGAGAGAKLIGEKIPFLALSAAITVATIAMQHDLGAFVLHLSVADRLGNAVVSIARYLGKIFVPANLVICYRHPGHWPWGSVMAAAVAVGALTWLAWRQRRARPWLATGWAWFVVLLLPNLGLAQVGFQAMADRFTYLAIFGAQLALLWTLAAWRASARLKGSLAGLALAAAALATWHQQGYWRDSETLYRHALEAEPDNHVVRAFLAFTYMEDRRPAEAAAEARAALEGDPANEWALLALAGAQQMQGQPSDAAETYRRLIAVNPNSLSGRIQQAGLLTKLGRLAEATDDQAQAVALAPNDLALREALAELLARQRRFAEAAKAYEEILARDPAHVRAHAGLGYMLLFAGRKDEALAHWREALRLQPDFPGLRERLERLKR